jgi:hypothetical protein
MTCKEVQFELVREDNAFELRKAIDAHLSICPDCRSVQFLYARVEKTLKDGPNWNPPSEFSQRVASIGVKLVQAPVLEAPPRLALRLTAVAVVAGLLIAALIALTVAGGSPSVVGAVADGSSRFIQLVARAFIVNAFPLAFAITILSLIVAAWFARRSLTSSY